VRSRWSGWGRWLLVLCVVSWVRAGAEEGGPLPPGVPEHLRADYERGLVDERGRPIMRWKDPQWRSEDFIRRQVKRLSSPDADERKMGAYALYLHRPGEGVVDRRGELALEVLMELAAGDPSVEVRSSAVRAIADIGTARAVSFLLERYGREREAEVRVGMVVGGGRRNRPALVPLYVRALEEDDDGHVLYHAAFRLGEVRRVHGRGGLGEYYDRAVSGLLRQARRERPVNAAWGAVKALGWYAEQRRRSVPVLLRALESRDKELRRQALYALGQLRAVEAVDRVVADLKRMLSGGESRYGVKTTVLVAGALGDRRVTPLLLEAGRRWRGWEWPWRELFAAFTLLGDPAAFDFVYRYVKRERPGTLDAFVAYLDALCALGSMGDRRAEPLLRRRAEAQREDIASSALVALHWLGAEGLEAYYRQYREDERKAYACWVTPSGRGIRQMRMSELVKLLEAGDPPPAQRREAYHARWGS